MYHEHTNGCPINIVQLVTIKDIIEEVGVQIPNFSHLKCESIQ
jgi:hypothetical protein